MVLMRGVNLPTVYICVWIHVYIYIYIHTTYKACIHTYVYIYMYTQHIKHICIYIYIIILIMRGVNLPTGTGSAAPRVHGWASYSSKY